MGSCASCGNACGPQDCICSDVTHCSDCCEMVFCDGCGGSVHSADCLRDVNKLYCEGCWYNP